MLEVIYNPVSGEVLPDDCIKGSVDRAIKDYLFKKGDGDSYSISVMVGGSLYIDYFRLAIVKGDISHKEIIFFYNGETMQPNEHGKLDYWPPGCCDHAMDILGQLI